MTEDEKKAANRRAGELFMAAVMREMETIHGPEFEAAFERANGEVLDHPDSQRAAQAATHKVA